VTPVDAQVNRASTGKPESDLTRDISSSSNASYFDDCKSGNQPTVQLHPDESGRGGLVVAGQLDVRTLRRVSHHLKPIRDI
jgi:hypothetical protein